MTTWRIQCDCRDDHHGTDKGSEPDAELYAAGLVARGCKRTVIYPVDIHEDQAEGEAA